MVVRAVTIAVDMDGGKRRLPATANAAPPLTHGNIKMQTNQQTRKQAVKEEAEAEENEEQEEHSDDEDDDDDDDAEPLQLDIDNFGRPHGVKGSLDYSFRSLHNALCIPDDKRYVQLVQDCETAFTARAIENAEYSTGTTFFLPATMEPRCVLERMAREVFDFHTCDVEAFDRSTSGAEWWTLVLDAGETIDDVAFHWDRDYSLEDQYHVNLHPHIATVTYLSDIGGPTIVLDKVSPVQTGSDDCGAGEIATAYVSRPVLGKHMSFDGRLLHGAPGDLATVFATDSTSQASSTGDKRKRDDVAIQNGRRVTFLVNVWLNHKPIESDPFPEAKLTQMECAERCGIKFDLEQAQKTLTPEDVIQVVQCDDEITTLELSFVEANRKMKLTLPVPMTALQEVVRKTPVASSFHVEFSKEKLAVLVAGEEVEENDDDESEEEEDSDEDDDDQGDDDDE